MKTETLSETATALPIPRLTPPISWSKSRMTVTDGTDQYARLDILTEGGSDAIERLRVAYDEWREENPCEKRPKPHERYFPALAAGGLIALLGLGVIALQKKKRVFIEGSFLDSLEDSHVAGETQMTTPYSMEQGIRA